MHKRELANCKMDMAINFGLGYERLQNNLIETLLRLPEEAYDFASTNIYFCSGSQAIVIKELAQGYIVILRKNDSQSVIAHEIAHAYLSHYSKTSYSDQEEKAETLRMKWGFKAKTKCNGYPKLCDTCFKFNCAKIRMNTKIIR